MLTHDELLSKIDKNWDYDYDYCDERRTQSLRAVVELHKNYRLDGIYYNCTSCGKSVTYCPTIQAIEKELE